MLSGVLVLAGACSSDAPPQASQAGNAGTAGAIHAAGRAGSETGGGAAHDGSDAGAGDEGGSGAFGADDPHCRTSLSAIGCPITYAAALTQAAQNCLNQNAGSPRTGTCGDSIIYQVGQDGMLTCAYDSSTHALTGGISCGIPGLYSGECHCHSAGPASLVNCAAPQASACMDSPPGDGGSAGIATEAGAAGQH